jgi:hypothetical protein
MLAALSVMAAGFAGCGGSSADGRLALVVGPSAGITSGDPIDYPTMCRHYCHTLEQTDFYACLVGGRSPDDCVNQVSAIEDQCFELRCAPELVQPSLCVQQCDSLDAAYAQACGPAAAPDVCPSPAADHDQSCRDGCVVAPAP